MTESKTAPAEPTGHAEAPPLPADAAPVAPADAAFDGDPAGTKAEPAASPADAASVEPAAVAAVDAPLPVSTPAAASAADADATDAGATEAAAEDATDGVVATAPAAADLATGPTDSAPPFQATHPTDATSPLPVMEPADTAAPDHADAQEVPAGTATEPPRPIFGDLGLSDAVMRAIDDMGYRHPTPIQAQAIPTVLMGRDVMGVAQTGTGKTASFTLPMLDILTGSRARARMPRSLILEPTRELALQVAENFVQYGKYLKLTHALIIGGESMADQKDVLTRGVDVLIATPGRLLDMFDRGTILLSDTKLLVIDEADRMLDMGFIPDVERIVSLLPAKRQTLFFSATMGPEIRRLADAFLREPKEITVSRPASVATTITEGLALVAEHDKREALRRLIRTQNVQNALIFCNKKVDVDILYKSLSKHRFSVGALHGDLAQTVRFTTLEKFKANELQLLVCSDVAARGIDIGGLSHVFNFDVPHHAEDYVHRIGRTGRAGLEGHAFTIAKPDDRPAIEAIEKLIGHPIPPLIVEGLDPVDWSEGDSRKRRGRGRKTDEPRKSDRARASRERAPRMREAGAETEAEAPRPRRSRTRHEEVATEDRAPRTRERSATRVEEPPRERRREERTARDERGRDERGRDERGRDDRPRDDRPRDDSRRERYRRDDDLGPAVLGFGDDVPAFMLLRTRTPRSTETTEPEA